MFIVSAFQAWLLLSDLPYVCCPRSFVVSRYLQHQPNWDKTRRSSCDRMTNPRFISPSQPSHRHNHCHVCGLLRWFVCITFRYGRRFFICFSTATTSTSMSHSPAAVSVNIYYFAASSQFSVVNVSFIYLLRAFLMVMMWTWVDSTGLNVNWTQVESLQFFSLNHHLSLITLILYDWLNLS